MSPALADGFLTTELPGRPIKTVNNSNKNQGPDAEKYVVMATMGAGSGASGQLLPLLSCLGRAFLACPMWGWVLLGLPRTRSGRPQPDPNLSAPRSRPRDGKK